MKRFLALLLLGAVGCAKFPDNPDLNQFTRISFTWRVAGKINTSQDDEPLTNYIYIVAIRASADDNPDPTTNPVPIFSPNPNGMVGGQPTHFVDFDTLNPQAQYPYVVYRFGRTGNPANPIDLATYTPVGQQIINFERPNPDSGVLRFDLYTNQLADSEEEARALKFIQVNFLTMNKRALSTISGRVIDFLGNNNNPIDLNKAITIDLRTNTIRENTPDYEPQGDTPDPDLDIVDWQIQVTRP